MTTALEEGEWSAARPGRTLPPGKTRYPFYRRLGGPKGRSGRAENLVPTGIRSRTVQPVVQSLYRLSYPAPPHTYTHTHTRTRTHAHTHTRTHTHIYIYTCKYIPSAFKNWKETYHILIRNIKYFLDDAGSCSVAPYVEK